MRNRNGLTATEYLSNDIMDDNFVKTFKPFLIVQKALGSCRVEIRDCFVTSPTIYQKCYTIMCMALNILSSYYVTQTYSKRFSNYPEMTKLWIAIVYGILIVYLISVTHNRFFNNDGNVNLYVNMQKIDRSMKLNDKESVNSKHYKRNCAVVTVLMTGFVFVLAITVLLASDEFGLLELVGTSWTLSTLILELCCCSSHLLYFTVRIRLINSIIADHFKKRNDSNKFYRIRKPADTESESFDKSDTDLYLTHIFNGFKYFQEQYSFQIFWFCAQLLAWILFSLEYGILALKSSVDMCKLLLDLAYLALLALVKVVVLLVMCVLSETFFREVKKTRKLSIFVMSRHIDGPLRKKAKNMLKLIEETPPSFSVYGMWHMNARLLLNVFHITSTFLVIILQFAFL